MNLSSKVSKITNKRMLCYFSIIAFMAVLAGCSSQAKPTQPHPPTVTVSNPMQEQIAQYNEFTGRFRAVNKVEVRARVDGYLKEIRFKDGQFVHKGQALFVIDQRPYKIALQKARAQLESAKAQFRLSKKRLNRAKDLRKTGAISQERLEKRQKQYTSAEAAVKAAKAAVHSAKLNLEFTKVKAPVSGRISQNFVSVGNLVSGGLSSATLLTRIVSLDPIYFTFEISEGRLIKYLHSDTLSGGTSSILNHPVKIEARLPGEKQFSYSGRIDFVDNVVDKGTGTLTVRAVFNNDNLLLTPGMFATVRLAPAGRHREILVPARTIASDQTERYVLVVNDSNRVARKFVKTGSLHNNYRIIKSGLTTNDQVIVSGFAKVRPGQEVSVNHKTNLALNAGGN